MAAKNRPLSPHLSVYRPQITSTLSILHRLTGVALAFGTLLLAWWLIAAAAGPGAFETAQGFFASIVGRIILFGFTGAVFYHLCNGIRHLFWDVGLGFELKVVSQSGYLVLAATAILTVATFLAAYAVRGG